MQRRALTILGFVVFGVGLWLALSLMNLQIRSVFEGVTTEQVYTILRSPVWNRDWVFVDQFRISMQDTQVTTLAIDTNSGSVQQSSLESKAVPPDANIGDTFASPDGAHTVTISADSVNPMLRLDDQPIAPGTDPAWSPDSTQFAFVNKTGDVLVYDVNQTQLRTIYPPLKIDCPQPVIPSTTRLTASITNRLKNSFKANVSASTTPPISIIPRVQEATLDTGVPQPLIWDARTTLHDYYQLAINAEAAGFSTTKSCDFYVMPSYLGSIGLLGGHVLAIAIMTVGFGLTLPRLLTRKRLWSKMVIALPFLAAIGFEIFLILRLLLA